MLRDSLFSEKIIWSGTPAVVQLPLIYRVIAWVLAGVAAVSTLLALAAAQTGNEAMTRLIIFSAWSATFALAVRAVPVLWSQGARFTVTDRHVIWMRGRFKRTMQREGISYARIQWYRVNPGVGDLELVRAVPTGALHRGLTIALRGVSAPDRVWSIVRGLPVPSAGGRFDLPMTQRLDDDERVVWSARPEGSWRSWLPMSTRRSVTALLGALCMFAALRTFIASFPMPAKLLGAGVSPTSLPFIALVSALLLTVVLLLGLAATLLYFGIVQKPLLDRKTQWLVTDKRVLLQRGRKEIHLDRRQVVDVIDNRTSYGGRDVYLVLDGPQSRALAAQGAFGRSEGVRGFVPQLRGVRDIKGLRKSLGLSASND